MQQKSTTESMKSNKKLYKLYNVPRNTTIRLGETELFFHHVDGMYSYCTTQDGDIAHLAAWTEVEIVDEKRNK